MRGASVADDDKKDEQNQDKALEKATAKSPTVLPPEMVEMLSKTTINVNNLLIQISEKTQDPKEFIKDSKELLEIAKGFDEQRLTQYRSFGEAAISLKTRDPDEVEKRRNNRARRFLKYVVGGGGVLGIAGGLVGLLVTSIPVAIAGLLLATGAVCLTLSAVLASGESVSTNDVVNIVRAVGRLAEPGPRVMNKPPENENTRKKGRT
jgi:hypothetical protein